MPVDATVIEPIWATSTISCECNDHNRVIHGTGRPRAIFRFALAYLEQSERSNTTSRLVAELCAGCHAVGVKDKSPHPWAPRTLGRTIDLDEFPRALERGITSTHTDMPTIKFSQEEARSVRAYLRAIQQ